RYRHELREPDQAEVDRAMVDCEDLPAHGDRDHLRRDAGEDHAGPEPAEVAVMQRRRNHACTLRESPRTDPVPQGGAPGSLRHFLGPPKPALTLGVLSWVHQRELR